MRPNDALRIEIAEAEGGALGPLGRAAFVQRPVIR